MGARTVSGDAPALPVFAIGDRVVWGTPGGRCGCCTGHKHKTSMVTVVSVPAPRPGGKITYAVACDDGIGVADARYLRKAG